MDSATQKNCSMGECILKSLRSLPQDFIIEINADTGESQTVRDLCTRSVQAASGLRKLGVQVEDVVTVLSHYSKNQLAIFFGCLLQGAALFPLEHNLKQREMEHMFKHALPKVVFVNGHQIDEAKRALKAIGHEAPIYVLDGEGEGGLAFENILDKDVDIELFESTKIDRPGERVAAVVPSSGTTGMPKGVASTHTAQLLQLAICGEYCPKTPCLILTPPFWISGFQLTIDAVLFGYQSIHTASPTAENIVRYVDKYKPGWSMVAPITMSRILHYPDLSKFDMSSLRTLFIGGSTVPKSTFELTKEKLPNISMCQGYGATEMTGSITVPFDPTDVFSAGRVLPLHDAKITHQETGNPVGPYESGELVLKSPSIMKCYLGNEQATRDAFTADGYYRTGDIAHVNDKGYLFITGRSKELIKVKNHQVSPAELEDVIRGLAGVADVAVVGIPHEIDQNHPRALVVKQPGSSLTLQQVIDEVQEQLSDTKQLFGGAQFVDALPRTTTGKLRRLELPKLLSN